MKTLSIKEVKKSLKKVSRLGHEEETIRVLGCDITLQTITQDDTLKSAQACRHLHEEARESDDTYVLTAWIIALQKEKLSRSIIQIDDLNFRDVKYVEIEDGEDEEGNSVPSKVHVHRFIRDLLDGWEDSAIDILYRKFEDLSSRAHQKASEGVQFLDEDIDHKVRIAELEGELEALRSQLSEQLSSENKKSEISKDEIKKQVFAPVQVGDYMYSERSAPKQEHIQQEPSTHPSQQHQVQQSVQEPNPVYYDEEGKPLSEEELAQAKELDMLYQRRKEAEAQRTQAMRVRQPLNDVDADIQQDHSSLHKEPRTINASKPKQNFDSSEIPQVEGEHEPTALTERVVQPKWDEVHINQKPPANINPNFSNSKFKI